MEKFKVGDWVLLPQGGGGKVFQVEDDGTVVVEIEYEYLAGLPAGELQLIRRAEEEAA